MRFFIIVDNAGNIDGQLEVADISQTLGMVREGFNLIEISFPIQDLSNIKWDFDTGSFIEKEVEAPE